MATYYIDPDWTGTQSGTEAEPFDSWADVTWGANNVYLQKRGTDTNSSPQDAGAISVANITLGAYGNGEKPIIRSSGQSTAVILNDGTTNCLIENLSFISDSFNTVAIISSTSNTNSFTIKNCHFDGAGNVNRIIFARGDGIKIMNSYLTGYTNNGVQSSSATDGIINNVLVSNCHFYQDIGTNDAVVSKEYGTVGDSSYWIVEGNLFTCLTGEEAIDLYGGTGHIIRNNIITEANGWGIRADSGDIEVYGNLIKNCNTDGIQMGDLTTRHFGPANPTCSVHNNILIDCSIVLDYTQPVSYGKIYNNTFIQRSNTSPSINMDADDATSVEIYNNIFDCNVATWCIDYGGGNASSTGTVAADKTISGNNIFINPGYASLFRVEATSYTDIEALQAAESQLEIDSLEADPKLNSDYTLQTSSPCIGAGTAPLSEKDFNGKYRKALSNDIGAKWFDAHEDSTVEELLASGGST